MTPFTIPPRLALAARRFWIEKGPPVPRALDWSPPPLNDCSLWTNMTPHPFDNIQTSLGSWHGALWREQIEEHLRRVHDADISQPAPPHPLKPGKCTAASTAPALP